jgi:hypothetical protein
MPYREKTAWLSLISNVLAYGPYFLIIGAHYHLDTPLPNLPELAIFGIAAIASAIILGIGHLYLRRASPQEARTPPDERDRAIMRRATSTAYYVLMGGMILVGVVMPFTSSGWKIVNAALLMIVVAEIVHYGVIVASYRRQA